MGYDLLIRNGRIIDGTGNPWFRADIGVVGDRIVDMGQLSGEARREIDARGHVLSPGFIDMHTHSDLMVFAEPSNPAKLQQGITTEVLTQDGKSVAPIDQSTEPVWRKVLAAVDGNPPIAWDWRSLGDYLEALEQIRPATNMATLVPFGNVRSAVLGFGAVQPSAKQLAEMKAMVDEGMQAGAFGMSFGLIYQPQMYATRAELTEVCKVVGQYRGMIAVHMRNEGDLLLEAVDEMAGICLESGCALHISHLKVLGKRNWEKADLLLEKLQQVREQGLDVTFDQYPYTAASTALHAVLPPWASEGGIELMVGRLREPSVRQRVAWEIEHMVGADRPTKDPIMQFWENFAGSAGWDGILVTSVGRQENRSMEGRTVSELAAERNQEPAEFVFDLLIEESGNVTMAAYVSSEENVRLFLAHEMGTIGSDGILVGKPHPRAYGTFPRALGHYVREEGVLSLPQMIRRMTSLPAQRLGLRDRGLIRPGMKADLVVFDPETVRDTATFANPRQFPEGIDMVVVNGVVAVQDRLIKSARHGQILRRS